MSVVTTFLSFNDLLAPELKVTAKVDELVGILKKSLFSFIISKCGKVSLECLSQERP